MKLKSRPTEAPTRHKVIYFRVTEEEHKAITQEAWRRNMLISTWCRAVLLQKLGREIGV